MLFVEERYDYETEMSVEKVNPDLFSFAIYDEHIGVTVIFEPDYAKLCEIHKHLGELIDECK